MFRRLTLRNFRSIEDAEVTIGPFGVVVGPNGSGKSNFSEAFVFMRDLLMDGSEAVSSRGGISHVRRVNPRKALELHLTLRIAPTRKKLETDFLEHSLVIHSGKSGAWGFKRERIELSDKWLVERSPKSVIVNGEQHWMHVSSTTSAMFIAREAQKIPAALRAALFDVRRYRFNTELMRRPQLRSESVQLDEDGANIATAVRVVREDVVRTMKHIVPDLRDIRVRDAGGYSVLSFVQGHGTFAANEISDGALRALGVVVAARQMRKNALLIIEEPEANIHAGAAQLIFDVLKQASRRGAVLITSHSPELLDAAQDEDILVCDYRSGVTSIGPLASAQRQLVKEGLFKLAELIRAEPLRIEGDAPATL